MTEEDTRESMAEIDHTHPHTDEPFGEPYRGGAHDAKAGTPTLADGVDADADAPEIRPDGGEPVADDADEREAATMADVDHAGSDEGVSRTFERGRVRTEDTE